MIPEGVIYWMFSPDRHILSRLPEELTVVESFAAGDGGTTDATSIGFYLAGYFGDRWGPGPKEYRLYRVGNWYYDGGQMAMSDQARRIVGDFLPYMRQKYRIRENAVYIDPACKALRLEIEKLGVLTTGADNNAHDVKGGVKGLKAGVEMLQSAISDGRFFLVEDERYGTEPFVKEAGLYCADGKGDPVDAYNHSMDETRYAMNHFLKTLGCGDCEADMKLIDRIRNRIRNGVNRMAESAEAFKKDVFDLEGVPAFREFYTFLFLPGRRSIKAFTRTGIRCR